MRRRRAVVAAVCLAAVAAGSPGCSDDAGDTIAVAATTTMPTAPPGLTVAPTTADPSLGPLVPPSQCLIDPTAEASAAATDPLASEPPADSVDEGDVETPRPTGSSPDVCTGRFESLAILGPPDETGAATVPDGCAYLAAQDGTRVTLLFPYDDLLTDGRFAYVAPEDYEPSDDVASYATDATLLRPGDSVRIDGEVGQASPADLGICPPGTDAATVVVVDRWSHPDG